MQYSNLGTQLGILALFPRRTKQKFNFICGTGYFGGAQEKINGGKFHTFYKQEIAVLRNAKKHN